MKNAIREHFARFRKIDAHSHIGFFGSPFNVDFNTQLLAAQMDEYNIEKTILCSAGAHLNEELNKAYKAMYGGELDEGLIEYALWFQFG